MLPTARRDRIVQQTAQRNCVAMSHLSLTARPCSSSQRRDAMRPERHLSIDRLQTAVDAWRMVRAPAIVARANVGQAPGRVRTTMPARPNPFDHT
ncbi:protein of unknown function (plasmid) [Azospirillum lipoferum 4B]|uniref:Uncharacterized protein n=1 Tax=Azospirillum lipoferum (strain 4B) TaxID=862719 RepID=G7ZGA6_AZOL4|nr:protein of unknown function [Azospirillum lipoferum 4B]